MRSVGLVLVLVAMSTPAFAAAPVCKAENAHYAMKGAPFTATFRKRGDVLDLQIISPSTRKDYWFAFDQGNGMDHIHVSAITDPRKGKPRDLPLDKHANADTLVTDIAFYPMTRDLKVQDAAPRPGEQAPDMLFIPELGAALWYDGEMLTERPLPNAGREDMPRAFFVLKSCGK